ncbi:MAG TPA: hypothetical protein VHV83_01945 [Armatimonadota bacterium]|nr:hypothetical protein [Armatimonadota bacterium]
MAAISQDIFPPVSPFCERMDDVPCQRLQHQLYYGVDTIILQHLPWRGSSMEGILPSDGKPGINVQWGAPAGLQGQSVNLKKIIEKFSI